MKVLTVVRLYWLATAILLIGWSVNLSEALAAPTIDWRDAAGIPSLVMIFITLVLLTEARRKLSADPAAVLPLGGARYVIAALAIVSLIGVALLGYFIVR